MKSPRSLLGVLATLAMLALLMAQPTPAGSVVSGANGRIVFVSNRDGDNEIYSMRADGTAVTQLTFNTANDYDPAVSGNGTRIAFISDRDGPVELYTMGIDGTNPTRLTTNSLVESRPAWAPNSKSIAFAAVSGTGDSEIYTINANGGAPTNLTNNATAFDADPSWSPGGLSIAFDSTNRNGDGKTDVYTMGKDGSAVTQLTTTGLDSNPSWSPDNKNLAFESARDNLPPVPSVFASVVKPDGVAVTSNSVLVTQFNSDKIKAIGPSGAVTNYATLPNSGLNTERYLAVAPGVGGWTAGDVYATVGPNTYKITNGGSTVTLFVNIPSMPNGETGITFDTVGTFGNKMILTDRRGPIWLVDSTGSATMLVDVGKQIEGPGVAPLAFAPYGGQILVGNEFENGGSLYAVTNTGTVSTVTTAPTPEAGIPVPTTVCNFSTSGGAYFVAMKDMNTVVRFPASMFADLTNDVLIPSEESTSIDRLHSDGSSLTQSTFWPAVGTPELEGSAFAPCGSNAAPRAPVRTGSVAGGQGPLAVAGPHEIYKMSSNGSGQTRLTTNTTDDINPAFSPDGLTITFQADRDDPNQPNCEGSGTCLYEVYKMSSSDGTGQTNITNNGTANDTSPDWEAVAAVVSVQDFSFTPSTVKPRQGGTVLWDFKSTHTATDNNFGGALFDSGTRNADGYYTFSFLGAGSYAVICTIHPTMLSTVKVPVTATPKVGDLTTTFTVTWAAGPAPSGYEYDVQILRPGAADWADWKVNQLTKTNSSFIADAGSGTYSFKARVQNTLHTLQTDYSTIVSITVNP